MKSYILVIYTEHVEYILNDNNIKYFQDYGELIIPIEGEENSLSENDLKITEILKSNNIIYYIVPDEKDKHLDQLKRLEESIQRDITVKAFIEYLQKQDPDSVVRYYSPNEFAYIPLTESVLKEKVRIGSEVKKTDLEYYRRIYNMENLPQQEAEKKAVSDFETLHRYTHNNDVIIRL